MDDIPPLSTNTSNGMKREIQVYDFASWSYMSLPSTSIFTTLCPMGSID
jgi:hypothetical protein